MKNSDRIPEHVRRHVALAEERRERARKEQEDTDRFAAATMGLVVLALAALIGLAVVKWAWITVFGGSFLI